MIQRIAALLGGERAMKISPVQLVPLLHGAADWEITAAGLIPYRFPLAYLNTLTPEDMGWYARASAGIRVCLECAADAVELRLLTTQVCDFSVPAVCEAFVNGCRVYCRELEQRLEAQTAIHISLNGHSRVEFWLPINQTVALESLELIGADAYSAVPVRERLCLWIGDSITQGFACGTPSETWTGRVARSGHMELFNQGVGGYSFRRDFIQPLAIVPDQIIVALGTNGSWDSPLDKHDPRGFFDALFKAWPHTPTTVITPIPRLSGDTSRLYDTLEQIRAAVSGHSNVRLIDGRQLLPPDANLFADGVHPNNVGMKMLAEATLSLVPLTASRTEDRNENIL